MTTAIAVVVSTTSVPAWVQSILALLDEHTSLDWKVTLVERGETPTTTGVHGLASRALATLDARRHAADLDDALDVRDATSMIAKRELVVIGERLHGRVDAVLDLRTSARGTHATPLPPTSDGDVLRIEMASDHHIGDDAIFWAIHDRQSTCDVRVVVERSDGAGTDVVAVGTVGLQPASLVISRSLCYWKAATLIIEHLSADGSRHARKPEASEASIRDAGDPRSPGVVATARVAARQGVSAARHRWLKRGRREQWILGYRERASDAISLDPVGFSAYVPPPDRTFADPFLVEHGSTTFLFLEEYEFARGLGTISVASVGDDGAPGERTVVLERPYHLSYPFVFRDGEDFFMIPETAANRTIELYRATDFPRGWVLEDVVMEDVRALDSTLIADNDRYFLLTSIEAPGRNRNDELHVFFSTSLHGPWSAHPSNPVVSDVRCARPAGRPFAIGDSLIRPAQDCSGRYGSAIVFRRIDVLDEDDYFEETIATLPATWTSGLLGTHTFATNGRIDFVDGLRSIPKVANPTTLREQRDQSRR